MPKKTLKEIMIEYNDLDLEITALRELLNLVSTEFGSRDGIPPQKIVLTDDGRRVPAEKFNVLLAEINVLLLKPLLTKQNELKELTVK